MGRKAIKPRTIFMIELTECLAAKGVVAVRFNGGGTSPDGVRIKYQVPHLTTETTLTVGVYGYSAEGKWYCSSIRYEESHTHARYHHQFDNYLTPHELCEFIANRFLPKIPVPEENMNVELKEL